MTPSASSTLSDWLAYIEDLHVKQIDMGLARIHTVYQRLGAQIACPIITVGGTNGKGSVCATLEAILTQAGYRVGLYTSPHIHQFNERARVNGVEVSDAQLVEHFAAVDAARDDTPLTYFEFTTLAILRLFAEAALDVVILEVGLGGRLDAVNLLDAAVAVVTNVAVDHVDYLGDNREIIGYEKAGIFRTHRGAICGDPNPPAALLAHAQSIEADLRLVGRDFGAKQQPQTWDYRGRDMNWTVLPLPAMQGDNQIDNAAIALAALEALPLPVSEEAIRAGLSHAVMPGRFQVLDGRPVVVLDVAHNPHAAVVLANNLNAMGAYARTFAIFGGMRDKDVDSIIAATKACIDRWYVTDLPVSRAMSAREISEKLRQADIPDQSIKRFSSPGKAYAYAAEQAGENDRIAVFGSFWVVAGTAAPTSGLS